MTKHVIWQNYDVDPDDYQDFLEEYYPEVTDEYEKQRLVEDLNYEYLEDERLNLDIELGEQILIIADLGLWDGQHKGYRETIWSNIKDALQFESDCEYAKFFVDEYGDLCSKQSHHDGTHELLYRTWKPTLSFWEREKFLEAIVADQLTTSMIDQYTNSIGKKVMEVYGW